MRHIADMIYELATIAHELRDTSNALTDKYEALRDDIYEELYPYMEESEKLKSKDLHYVPTKEVLTAMLMDYTVAILDKLIKDDLLAEEVLDYVWVMQNLRHLIPK